MSAFTQTIHTANKRIGLNVGKVILESLKVILRNGPRMLTTGIKFLYVLLLLALVTGCGKKINDTGGTVTRQLPQKLERNLTLVVDEVVSLTTHYHLPESALFKLPTELKARFGNAIGKKIQIFYNYSSSNQYEFRCTYSSTDKDSKLAFVNCETSDGHEMISRHEDINEIWFPVDKGSRVKLELINPSGTRMNIETAYLVDWK